MTATVFAIASRHREHENQLVDVSDFELIAEGSCDAQRVLEDPACTLYCLDAAKQRALFVETPPHIELSDAPFLYQAQFQHARRAVAITYADLLAAAAQREEPPAGLGFIYSVGRSGSTLLGRALHDQAGVQVLAEPDALTQLIAAPPDTPPELLSACVRLLCKPRPGKRASHHVIKFRHQGIKLGGALQERFPSARAVFIYRGAIEMVRSSLRAFHPLPLAFREYHQDPVRFMTRQWLSVMQHYLKLYRSGVAIRAVHYADLIADPQRLFAAICAWYGLEAPDGAVLDATIAADAQAGSNLSRENLSRRSIEELGSSAAIADQVRDTLASHPEINRPDFVVPGTLAGRSRQ